MRKVDVYGRLKSTMVSPNLESALRRFRHESSPRTLWIDALCIDQNELSKEPQTQIPNMAQIYSQASQVYIWLGPEADNSATTMK